MGQRASWQNKTALYLPLYLPLARSYENYGSSLIIEANGCQAESGALPLFDLRYFDDVMIVRGIFDGGNQRADHLPQRYQPQPPG
jgi:hypothetical protein